MSQLTLQLTTIADAASLLSIFSNPENVQFTNFGNFENLSAFEGFLEKFLAIEKDGPLQYGPFCIYVDGCIAGLCGLQQISLTAGKAELWYLLHPHYWGKGLAKQAVDLLLAKGRQNPQLTTVYAEAVTSNAASWRILERVGFTKTLVLENGFIKNGIVADLACYTLNLGV